MEPHIARISSFGAVAAIEKAEHRLIPLKRRRSKFTKSGSVEACGAKCECLRMRLINVHSVQLEEFSPDNIPRYAILSHTWGSDEVLFNDLKTGDQVLLSDRHGYWKVESCCKQVRLRPGRIDYLWVDTCCIDKNSSAELSEAINSMFQYYAAAEYCLVYLEDFEDDTKPVLDNLRGCRWFTRGWTLQELIAPGEVCFMSKGWKPFGRRSELAAVISEITGIALNIVTDDNAMEGYSLPYQDASIAQRMSWVASRSTTREEDMAYCLLGIFDISIPVLYGEGLTKAFHRLQEEIVKTSSDHSIFVHDSTTMGKRSILADTPKAFANYGNVIRFEPNWVLDVSPFSLSNRGVQLEVPLKSQRNGAVAVLACRYRGDFRGPLGLELDRSKTQTGDYMRRANPPHVVTDFADLETGEYKISSIYISQKIRKVEEARWANSQTSIWVRVPTRGDKCNIVKTWPFWFWNASYQSFSIDVNRIWDQHYNDHLTLPFKDRQLLRKEAGNLRIPAVIILSDNHQALGSGFGHVVVVTLRLQRLTSDALCPEVDFDVFPLLRTLGRLEDVEVDIILKEIGRRRGDGKGSKWSPEDEEPSKLQSIHGQLDDDDEQENDEDNPRSLAVTLCRRHLLGEDVYVVDIMREKPKLDVPEQKISPKSVNTAAIAADEEKDIISLTQNFERMPSIDNLASVQSS